MHRTILLALIIALSLLGVADSWYLLQSAVTDTALTCDIGAGLDGCNIVAQSPYSKLFGVPLALYGVGFFGLIFLGALALLFSRNPRLYLVLLGLAGIGAAASVVFLYIQFVLIKALCIYCLLSAAIAFALILLAWWLFKRHAVPSVTPVL